MVKFNQFEGKCSKENGYNETKYLINISITPMNIIALCRVWEKDEKYFCSFGGWVRDVTSERHLMFN